MKRIFIGLTLACSIILFANKLYSQSLPAGALVLEDYYRRSQLLGKVDPDLSFSLRPLQSNIELNTLNIFDPDSTIKKSTFYFDNKRGAIQILPLSWQQQLNSDHPYGWNDGPMIAAKG